MALFIYGTATRDAAGAGVQTSGMIYAGAPTKTRAMSWDGSSWANLPNLATNSGERMGAGTSSAAFAAGGDPAPSVTAATEEYSGTVTLKTVTDS